MFFKDLISFKLSNLLAYRCSQNYLFNIYRTCSDIYPSSVPVIKQPLSQGPSLIFFSCRKIRPNNEVCHMLAQESWFTVNSDLQCIELSYVYVYLEYLTKFYLTKAQNYHWDEKILIMKSRSYMSWISLAGIIFY